MFLLQELTPMPSQVKSYKIQKITPEGVFKTPLTKCGVKLLEFLEKGNFTKTQFSKNPSIYNIKIEHLFEGTEEELIEFLLENKPELVL